MHACCLHWPICKHALRLAGLEPCTQHMGVQSLTKGPMARMVLVLRSMTMSSSKRSSSQRNRASSYWFFRMCCTAQPVFVLTTSLCLGLGQHTCTGCGRAWQAVLLPNNAHAHGGDWLQACEVSAQV